MKRAENTCPVKKRNREHTYYSAIEQSTISLNVTVHVTSAVMLMKHSLISLQECRQPIVAAIESACASLCVDLGICTLGVELVKLVIDCSSVLAEHPEVKVAQLQAIQFHSIRLCYALHSLRFANDVDKRRISSIHGSPYVYIFLRPGCPCYSKRRCVFEGGIYNIQLQ